MFARLATRSALPVAPARSFSASSVARDRVTVIGGGLMGSGIVQTSAQSGHKVTLVDVNEAALKKSVDSISKVGLLLPPI